MLLPLNPLLGVSIAQARRAVGLSAVMAISAAAIPFLASGVAAPLDSDGETVRLPPAAAPPLLLRDVAREDALSINAAIPFSRDPNPAARPFKMRGGDGAFARALHCLTEAIYYEADSETADGQRAVAQVVLNRVRHPAFSPSVCATVYHGSLRSTGCQFSFTCDGSMRRRPAASGWAKARGIAEQALAGYVFAPVGQATHYHADYVVPYWATSLAKNAVLGTHIFYRWRGWWGQRAAFARRHSGQELDPRLLRNAALSRHGVRPEPPAWSGEDLVLAADPRVELISIVHLLANQSEVSADATEYEKDVRKRFAAFSNHVAVEIYRQLSAGNSKFTAASSLETLIHYSQPPKLESQGSLDRKLIGAAGGKRKLDGFIAALRDFVRHSEFESFFKEREAYYAKLEKQAREPAFELVTAIEKDTGAPVHNVRFILAPLLAKSGTAGCRTAPKQAADAWAIVGLGDPSGQPFKKAAELGQSLGKLSESECLSQSGATIANKADKPVRGG